MSDQNDFEIDAESAKTIGNPTATGTSIRLPFTILDMWWKNGNTAAQDGVLKFGGWAANADVVETWLGDFEDLPTGLAGPLTWTGELDHNEYDVYAVRAVWVAPLVRRFAWFLKESGLDPDNPANYKSSLQYLCYAANVDLKAGTSTPLGPMVIGAKGTTAIELDAAFAGHKKLTAAARKEHAGNAPANLFYACIGTFGNKINFKEVGSKVKNNITPPVTWVPSIDGEVNVDKAFLKATFCNPTIQAVMAGLKLQAAEWADDWNKRNAKNKDAQSQPGNDITRTDFSGAPEDDIPF